VRGRTRRPRWLAVAGARPNFVKLAPLVRAARAAGATLPWVHTGQHWDAAMSQEVIDDLGLPPPVEHLSVGAGSASEQTARILERLPRVLAARRPDVVVVVGDVTSTLAAALAASQAGIAVAHVEAGLRSFDWSMPEERNRVVVDRLSARLYVTEPSGVENLAREGIAGSRVRLVGNPMIDALRHAAPEIERRRPAEEGFALVTLHRPSNVDEPKRLAGWARALAAAARRIPVRFPVHPRTAERLRERGLDRPLAAAGVALVPPLGYLDFVAHLGAARVVLTDSGGVQEEAAYLGVPCLTLRTTTERPMTIERGTNRLVGDDPASLGKALDRVLAARAPRRTRSRLWDGRASERIVADLRRNV
jgi:UDP-N-acetylglucosamine 2-epimerase (non-hydrolysing)